MFGGMVRPTWYQHQHAVGHDQHVHRRDALRARQEAAVLPHVRHEPEDEHEAEPADGRELEGEPGVPQPQAVVQELVRVVVREQGADLVRLGDEHERHLGQGEDAREGEDPPLVDARPELDHRPRLQHERRHHQEVLRDAEDDGAEAVAEVDLGDVADVAGVQHVEAHPGRLEVEGEEDRPHHVVAQGGQVDVRGKPPELAPGGHGEEHAQHHEAGTKLYGVPDCIADDVRVVGVDGCERYHHEGAVRRREGDVLVQRVIQAHGRVVQARLSRHGGSRSHLEVTPMEEGNVLLCPIISNSIPHV